MWIKFKKFALMAIRYSKQYAGQLAYYGAVALVLSVVAWAAQAYRADESIPAAQTTAAASSETIQQPLFEALPPDAILTPYSSAPSWNHQLKCWQNHTAVDYISADGYIHSLSDGIVQGVGKDGRKGSFIEIRTEDYLLRYASAEAAEGIEAGAEVTKGQRIGTATSNLPAEAHMQAHVHLEVECGGEMLDYLALQDKISPLQ